MLVVCEVRISSFLAGRVNRGIPLVDVGAEVSVWHILAQK